MQNPQSWVLCKATHSNQQRTCDEKNKKHYKSKRNRVQRVDTGQRDWPRWPRISVRLTTNFCEWNREHRDRVDNGTDHDDVFLWMKQRTERQSGQQDWPRWRRISVNETENRERESRQRDWPRWRRISVNETENREREWTTGLTTMTTYFCEWLWRSLTISGRPPKLPSASYVQSRWSFM